MGQKKDVYRKRSIDDEYKTEVLDKMEAMEQERIQLRR